LDVQPIDGEAIAASLADPRAFGVIFERHFGVIHGYLRRRLDRTLADELAPQTFLVAFDGREIRELRAMAELAPDPAIGIDGVEARVDAERLRGDLAQGLADLPTKLVVEGTGGHGPSTSPPCREGHGRRER
jgi:hypothetical protein